MEKFTCYSCKKTFPERNDEEWNYDKRMEEYINLYPECKDDAFHTVCDYCNEQFKSWFDTLTDDQKRKMREDFHKQSEK